MCYNNIHKVIRQQMGHFTSIKMLIMCNRYLLIVAQAAEISNQSVLLCCLSYSFCQGLGLALLRPVENYKPRLRFTGHAKGTRKTTFVDLHIPKGHFSIDLSGSTFGSFWQFGHSCHS